MKKLFILIVLSSSLSLTTSCSTTSSSGTMIQTKSGTHAGNKKSGPSTSRQEPVENMPAQAVALAPPSQPLPLPLPIEEKKESSFFSFFGNNTEKPIRPKSAVQYPTDTQKIGLILPLTGKNSNIAQHALTAIRLGLGLNEPSPKFSLAIYDSQGNADLAAAGVEKLLKSDNVVAIMGGLGSKEAQAISDRADFFEVPFFTFSQKPGLTLNTDFTFRNAVTPNMQMDALVEHAVNKLSLKRFAILYPNDSYGVEFANRFWDHVLARGGTIVAAQSYDSKNMDLSPYIKKIVGTYYAEARPEEFATKKAELLLKKKKKVADGVKKNSRESETEENILEPIVDFDAIFIPDSGRILGQALAFMKSSDVLSTVYLGTNLWNTADIVSRVGHSAKTNRVFFVDANVVDEKNIKSEFYQKYFAVNQEEPTLLEAQAFEAAKILREELSSGLSGRASLASELRSLGRRRGAFEEIRMNGSNEIERPLSVLTLDNGLVIKQ